MATSYDAFISYSHAADGKLAPALQNALQRFAKPWYQRRALHLFRDQTSLSATPGLWPAIEAALQSSHYFLLLASPEAAQSRWVQQEVRWWLEHQSPQTMLIGLTDGTIAREEGAKDFDWEATNALPPNLKGMFTENPLWVDFRWAKGQEHLSTKNPEFQNALAALAAPLRGIPKEDLIGEDVHQHHRAQLLARGAVVVLTLLLIVAILSAARAVQSEREAVAAAELAKSWVVAASGAQQMNEGNTELGSALAIAADQIDTTGTPAAFIETQLRRALDARVYGSVLVDQPGARYYGLAFDPKQQLLVAGGCRRFTDARDCEASDVMLWDLRQAEPRPQRLPSPPTAGVYAVAIRPDGTGIAAAGCTRRDETGRCDEGEVTFWRLIDQPEGVRPTAPERLVTGDGAFYALGAVSALSFNRSGTRLAAAGCGLSWIAVPCIRPEIALWRVQASGASFDRYLAVGNAPKGTQTLAIAFAGEDDDVLLSGGVLPGSYGELLRWDLVSGQPELISRLDSLNSCTWEGTDPDHCIGGVAAVAAGSNGAVAYGARDFWVWTKDSPSADDFPVLLGHHGDRVSSVAWSPSGRLLLTTSQDGMAWVWDRQRPGRPTVIIGRHTAAVTAAVFGRDDRTVFTASEDGTVRRWTVNPLPSPVTVHPGDPIGRSGHRDAVLSLAFDPLQASFLVSGSKDQQVIGWDPYQEEPMFAVRALDVDDDVSGVAFDDQGNLLAVSTTRELWVLARGDLVPEMDGRLGDRRSKNDRLSSEDGYPGLLLVSDKEDPGSSFTIRHVGFRPSVGGDPLVAAAGCRADDPATPCSEAEPVIRFWSLCDPTSIHDCSLSVVWNWRSDGDKACSDRSATNSGVALRSGITGLAFGSNGSTLAAGTRDGTILIWRLDADGVPTCVWSAKNPTSGVTSLAFDPMRPNELAVGDAAGGVALWDLEDADQQPTVIGRHDALVWSLAFSPDGQLLASGGADLKVNIWTLNRPDAGPKVLAGFSSAVHAVAFGREPPTDPGRPARLLLAAGSLDAGIRVFDVTYFAADGEALKRLVCQRLLANPSQADWDWYVGGNQGPGAVCPGLPIAPSRASGTPAAGG